MTKPSYEERRITKHSGSPQIADSARNTESSSAAKETRLFGYKCQTCHKGTVGEKLLENYETKIGGVPVSIPLAKVGECDICGARYFNAKEVKRWKTIAGR